MSGEPKKASQSGESPENAKRAYMRPVTRNIVSSRTMAYGEKGVLGRNETESAINRRELNMRMRNINDSDTSNYTTEQALRAARNDERIQRAAERMRKKTNTRQP